MGTDQAVEIMRHLLREAMLISAPILLAASLTSFLLSLLQTLTSLQEQTLTTVPRLLIVVGLILAGLPWFAQRLVWYTVTLFTDLRRYLG
ncbi:flagellar biosynthetic protein FliQ [Silvibacterium bohemicum]|uniref:Flagellar biosynthetic protein FliQ n=1 Tax=Silvibacterium bohemicum TaxID=1577686 RepID=A0A841K800_9BACT|nr:flagellar biosynthetic protein FliQ [Silvibacterium bohemicum]MBB6147231.1 flagellar biosynthetic protein FliQ [Silvibacterium bohemicum]